MRCTIKTAADLARCSAGVGLSRTGMIYDTRSGPFSEACHAL
jgi:hypothetical protein